MSRSGTIGAVVMVLGLWGCVPILDASPQADTVADLATDRVADRATDTDHDHAVDLPAELPPDSTSDLPSDLVVDVDASTPTTDVGHDEHDTADMSKDAAVNWEAPLLDGPFPPGIWSEPVAMEDTEGRTPSLHVTPEGALLLHYDAPNPEQDDVRWLYQRRLEPDDDVPGPPTPVLPGGEATHLWFGDDVWLMTAAHDGALRILEATPPGDAWEVVTQFTSTDNWTTCVGDGPGFLAAMPGGLLLAYAFHHHNAVFGCTARTRVRGLVDGDWSAEEQVSNGWPSGLWSTGVHAVIAGGGRVLVSHDGGATWTEDTGGDTTAERLGGTDLAADEAGALYTVQTYNYGNQDHLALLRSTDQGDNWARQVLRSGEVALYESVMSITDDAIAVVWRANLSGEVLGSYHKNDALVMVSKDLGATWSVPVQINASKPGIHVTAVQIAWSGSRLVVAWSESGEDPNWDPAGVYLSVFTPE